MAFNWDAYIEFAREGANDADECSWRCAVSRAYYAVYHLASAKLKAEGFAVNEHKECWRLFASSQSVDCQRIGSFGSSLKTRRIDADYNAAKTLTNGDATLSVSQAERLVDYINNLPAGFGGTILPAPQRQRCPLTVACPLGK